jgi:hypothetical protein
VSFIESAWEMMMLLKTERVPAARILKGDIILPHDNRPSGNDEDVMFVTGVQLRPNADVVTISGNEPSANIQRRSTDQVRRLVHVCHQDPPISKQWESFADKLSAVESMQTRVQSMRERDHSMHWAYKAKELVVPREGFCKRCGLPVGSKHAEHDPEFEVREEGSGGPYRERVIVLRKPREGHNSDFPIFMRVRRKAYQASLKSLTDGELMEMPIPFMGMFTACLIDELTDRIAKLPKPRTRYDILSGPG